MSVKRMIPIFVLLALVIGIAACGPKDAEEAVQLPAEAAGVESEQAIEAEAAAPTKALADGTAVKTVTAPPAASEPQADALPGFVPPQPVALALDAESVAFSMGDPNAPVQIVEFTDYQCPFCGRYAMETMPALVENLVESGRVFYAMKDLPLDTIHPEARTASVAARCGGEQDAFLAMHDAIFAAQPAWSGAGAGAEAVFAGLAADLDLDVDAFETCLADGQQAEYVQANVAEARALGIGGTPFFFINGYGVSGAQPYEMFEMAVEVAEAGELDAVVETQARQAYAAMLAQQAAGQQAAGAQQAAGGQQAAAAQQPAAAQPAADVQISLENTYTIGDPDAPVTIVEYTDFQCPFCSRHGLETFPQIEQTLVDTGKVRYVFKDLPLTAIHPQAMLAAEAARCAGAQDESPEAYATMHALLFEKQGEWSGQANAADLFAGYANGIGLDGDSFAACLENHDTAAAIQADMQEARALGINGTPAFVINGHLVSGALPFDVFAEAVDALIASGEEESGTVLALNEGYDAVRNGARLVLNYDARSNAFTGFVENTTASTLPQVRVEVHLSNGVELGPTTPADLKPGESMNVSLAAADRSFDAWTAHPEVGGGEHGEGDGEHGEQGEQGEGEHGEGSSG